MKPEEEIEIELWDWLKTKSQIVKEIYFNRKNCLSAPVFTTSGINKKPDFLIKIDLGYNKEFIAVEIKDNNRSKNVLDGGKILDTYYYNYTLGHTKYFINSEEIKINYFIVATQSSKKGFLFDDEEFISANESDNASKKYVASIGLIPKREGRDTHQYVRNLWSSMNRLIDNHNIQEKPALGILIGDDNRLPKIMIKKWIDYMKNKKPHWSQRWIAL